MNVWKVVKRYTVNVLTSVDQLANTVLGGDPDETISSRAGKSMEKHGGKKPWSYLLCRTLHILDKDHCKKAIEEDEGKDAIQNQ